MGSASLSTGCTSEPLRPTQSEREQPRLTHLLWGLDWAEHVPVDLGDTGVTVELTSFEAAMPFISAHYELIFEEQPGSSKFKQDTSIRGAKERYYQHCGDFFDFRCDGESVGLLIGAAADWSTYYIRSAAILPGFQGKRLHRLFFPTLFDALRGAGIERVEADTSPSNFAVLRVLESLSFNPTGMTLSDRWGAHVHLTKYLDESSETVFLDQFCSGVAYQRQDRRRARPTHSR